MFKNEKIYIAGPECFYTGGFAMLNVMRRRAETLGFGVTLPNDNPLDMENPVLQKRADSIFADLVQDINATTVIIADLEAYRGSEADSGTVFEIGMAYAKGARCYGYTRDKRPLAWKDQKYRLVAGRMEDESGAVPPYPELPFSPCVIGSTKIVEGDFDDCLRMLMTDIEEEQKQLGSRVTVADHSQKVTREKKDRPLVYLATPDRYQPDAAARYSRMRQCCEQHGLAVCTPLDMAPGVEECSGGSAYAKAANLFDRYQQHVRNCDAVIADLNNYRGYECSNDVGFECGMGFQLGKKLFGYMEDARPMAAKVPHFGAEREYRDFCGCNVENFDYPLNLMFGCTMPVFEGNLETAVAQIARELLG